MTFLRAGFLVFSTFGLLTLAAPSARADIFAATCVSGPTSQDIAILNASLGTPVALPAAVNTSGIEMHPTISTDGRRLAFERIGPGASQRLIVADLATGQSADLFTGFEIAQNPIFRSALTPDGTTVASGRSFREIFTFFFPQVTLTSLASFPTGPFSRTTLSPTLFNLGDDGFVLDVAAAGNLVAMHLVPRFRLGEIALALRGENPSSPSSSPSLRSSFRDFSQPALAATNRESVLFVQRNLVTENGVSRLRPGDIVFRPAAIASFVGTPTLLGLGVSTSRDESQPALTADGRYVGFVRDRADGTNDRLFVWDSQTQTFLNPNGIDLGLTFTNTRCGSLSLYVRNVIAAGLISSAGNVTATLTQASNIGIFVQRIVGKTRVLGRKTHQLETVGRVPLGSYGAGNVFTHWDFEVGGEPLEPGRYLVTLRAVDGDVVREFGEPQVLRIRKRK